MYKKINVLPHIIYIYIYIHVESRYIYIHRLSIHTHSVVYAFIRLLVYV